MALDRSAAPPFHSIVFPGDGPGLMPGRAAMPPFFRDVNLDQVVEAVTAGRDEYDLAPFFYTPLPTADSVAYRHEVLADLESAPVLESIRAFARAMRTMRERLSLAGTLYYPYQQKRWHLDAVASYCDAVTRLADDLSTAELSSRGLRGFRDHLAGYVASGAFTSLAAETRELGQDLAGIVYTLQVKGNRIRVGRYSGEGDYSADVAATFEKFRQDEVKDYRVRFPRSRDMNHVEAGILGMVAKLHPEIFETLDGFCARHQDFTEPVVTRFDREIQFYIAYLEFAERLRGAGLEFCRPRVSAETKEIHARATFDLALAAKLTAAGADVVRNDFHLTGGERILVVTGPNQGGKTTLARTFGQLHHLARLGLPVPGRDARLYLCDQVFTHFEKEESLSDLNGKLADDLARIRDILRQATPRSVVIMNEIFTSTTLHDAAFLAGNIMRQIIDLDALCVCVTFLDELASMGPGTVSMVATVDSRNPAHRTFKLVRRPADGLAYAMAVAARHGLTYEQLRERVAS